jgi:hypothetical protein
MVARRTRWLRAVLIAPVLVFALGASSHLAVRCTMSGLLMSESCGPQIGDLTPPAPAPQPSVGEAGCCERVTVATARIPAAGSESLHAPAQFPLSQATPVALLVARRPPPSADRRAARPPGWPPLYVVTQAFLI